MDNLDNHAAKGADTKGQVHGNVERNTENVKEILDGDSKFEAELFCYNTSTLYWISWTG